ncbi:armadillo-type fold domain-containing protein [Paramyrothecium foliicola]|nr:armadillo-type fold domain-containing protein [Paramyrothecium foliicola]
MGKSRRNRANAGQRKDPIVKPVKPPSDPELAALREAKILPIVKQLQSADPKARSAAASAISNIIQDTKCRKLLLREQVVHTVLTQTLTDTALESRAAGWGILQVLAQEEDADFCIHLYRLDVITAIEHAAKIISDNLTVKDKAFSTLPKPEQALVSSIAASVVSLVTALAEAQDDILLSISSKPTIINLLFVLISSKQDVAGELAALRTDALACLMILCEDNTKLAEDAMVSQAEGLETLMTLKDDVGSDGVLACAILHNMFTSLAGTKRSKDAIPDDSVVIPTLSKTIATINLAETSVNGGGWSSPIEYQQLALETLASIGTTLNLALGGDQPAPEKKEKGESKDDENMDDADDAASDAEEPTDAPDAEDDGDDDEEEDDEMDEDEMEADMDMVTGVDNDDADDMDDVPVLKSLLNLALPELIRIAASQPSSEDAIRLQGHALSALNNLTWSVSLVDFSEDHNEGIKRAWLPLGRAVWENVVSAILASDTADIGLATQVTGLAWAVARSLRGSTPLKPGEHRKFITLYQATKGSDAAVHGGDDDPFQRLGVKCVGVLGQLAQDPAPVDVNREIGTFLVTLVAGLPDTPAADAVEALNQIFDMYGDEEYAYDKEVFWKDGFLKHLDDAMPKARAMLKSIDKKSQGELRSRADEAILNLSRFLAYKRKHKP